MCDSKTEVDTTKSNITIKMDFREDASEIGQILSERYCVEIVKESLPAGDYIIGDEIAVERKTALDFARSIVDGRLFTQAAKMRRFFESALMIIEGDGLCNPGIAVHPHAIKGALVSVAIDWQIPLLFSGNTEETALLLWLIASQNAASKKEISYRPGRRPKRYLKRQLYILQGLPQVGPKLAGRLLAHFGSVEKVFTAPDEELRKVPGLGEKRARMMRNIISTEALRFVYYAD